MGWPRILCILGTVLVLMNPANTALAQERTIRLGAPEALVETGFLKFLLPRFSLKNAVRITIVPLGADADARLTDKPETDTTPAFAGGDVIYYLGIPQDSALNPNVAKLADWLSSEIGQKAIVAFAGEPSFSVPPKTESVAPVQAPAGNIARGAELSLVHCGRCHVIGEQNRMKGIGSTPSFGVIRTLDDWENRFGTFYVLKPHPSFSRVQDISAPFAEGLSPAIAPVVLTIEELEDILAYAASVPPADLGAPIKHQ